MTDIYQRIQKAKTEFEMRTGKKPTKLKIGKKALDCLIVETFPGAGVLYDVSGLTPILSGTEWTIEVED